MQGTVVMPSMQGMVVRQGMAIRQGMMSKCVLAGQRYDATASLSDGD